MKEFIGILIITAIQLGLCLLYFRLGWQARERKFQDKEILFQVDGESVMAVTKQPGLVCVEIIDQEKIKFTKETRMVEGMFPLSFVTGKEDDRKTMVKQRHIMKKYK